MSMRDSTREGAFEARRDSKSAPRMILARQKTVTLRAHVGIEIGAFGTHVRCRARRVEESLADLRGRRNQAPIGRTRT
jgi:hypothetical protein